MRPDILSERTFVPEPGKHDSGICPDDSHLQNIYMEIRITNIHRSNTNRCRLLTCRLRS